MWATSRSLLCFAMFCYVLLCFCYVFAMFCYVLLCFCYVLLGFAVFFVCFAMFCYVLLCWVSGDFASRILVGALMWTTSRFGWPPKRANREPPI